MYDPSSPCLMYSVIDTINKDMKNIVVNLIYLLIYRDLSRVNELKRERRSRRRKFHIVTPDWIRYCMEEGDLASERQFEPS